MSTLNDKLHPSHEAIAFQHESPLFKALVVAFTDFRSGKLDELSLATQLQDITKKYTNLYIVFGVIKNDGYDARCVYVKLDKNSPLFVNYSETFRTENERFLTAQAEYIVRYNPRALGWVDRKTGTVHGTFEQIGSRIVMSNGLLSTDVFLVEEVAAIYLHELGHAFTYLESVGEIVSVNFALATIAAATLGINDITRRVGFLKTASAHFDLATFDVTEASTAKEPTALAVILVDARIRAIRSQTGLTVYDANGAEALCDQFATRHGAGRYFVTGLDKIYRLGISYSGDLDYSRNSTRVLTHIAEVALFAGSIVLATVIPLVAIVPTLFVTDALLKNPLVGKYDRIGDRFQRIRNDTVNALKQKGLSKEQVDIYLDDIATIDNITKDIKPYFSFLEWLALTLRPKFRKEFNQKQLEQELEKLATNDLFIKAAQFTHLK